MAITVAKAVRGTAASGTTVACSFVAPTTTGNMIVVVVCPYNSAANLTVSSIALSAGAGTFTKFGISQAGTSNYPPMEVWIAPNITGGTNPTVTATLSGSSTGADIFAYELAGMSTTAIADGTMAGAAQAAATACITPNITTTNAGSIIFGCFSPTSSMTAQGSGWTGQIGSTTANLVEYQIETAIQTNVHATGTQNSSAAYGALIFALAPTGGVVTLHFPLTVADTSAVTIGFHGASLHPPLIVADTSSVTISFHGGTVPTPTQVQHVAFGMDCNAATNFTFPFPNPTLSGNLLIIGFQFSSAGSITSVTDNIGNTYTSALTPLNNATYSQKMALYYCAGATAGVTAIKVTFSGLSVINTNYCGVQAVISEWYNVATSSAVDGTPVGSATSVSPGAITTTQANDLIYHWGVDIQSFFDSGVNKGGTYNGTLITAGSGFTLLSADLQVGSADQYQLQSAAGSISPTFTPSGSKTWASIAVAFKAAFAGTAPSATAMRIVNVQHTLMGNITTASKIPPIPLQFPSRGNLLVGLFNSIDSYITAVSDSNSNTWSVPASAQINYQSNIWVNAVYAANATTGAGLKNLTFTMSNTYQAFLVLYDVVNAATAPFDKATTASGDQTVAGALTTTSITPASANGLVLAQTAISFGCAAAMTTSGGIFDGAVNALNTDNPGGGGTDNSSLEEDNAYGHVYNATTSAISVVWTFTSGSPAARGWAANSAAFKAALATLSFPMAVADTSAVGIALRIGLRLQLAVADTSAVTLALRIGQRFALAVADTSTVALGFRIGQRFPLAVTDTSSVALGFRIGQRFPLAVADTSTVTLIYRIKGHFPVQIVDTSSVTLGFHVTRDFALQVADTSSVLIGFHMSQAVVPVFPLQVADISSVLIGFENDNYQPQAPQVPLLVPSYAGQDQRQTINVNPDIAWRESQPEEGPWVIPPYAPIFPEVQNSQDEATTKVYLPPPVKKLDIFAAQQTFPL